MELNENNKVLNINVGILGHVDSGKTTLVKALSTSLSTAALDKNPQSQRRGITLDLGFSSFSMNIPEHLQEELKNKYDQLQFTLVDCPGHASLIRTIIGGAQIIDMIVLVIDINKGIQTQTAECIVIGEITTDKMIIVLNKVDMIPLEDRNEKIEKMSRRIKKVFSLTKFADPVIIVTSAMIGGEKVASIGALSSSNQLNKQKKEKTKEKSINSSNENTSLTTNSDNNVNDNNNNNTVNSSSLNSSQTTIGIDNLLEAIRNNLIIPKRDFHGPFHFSIDHCFAIKGHGTVLTGTILSGMVTLNQMIELPELQLQRKVKSMQMFHKPVKVARQGDRVGICVTNLDSSLIERGIATSIPSPVTLASTLICLVRKVRFFKQQCLSNTLFHISIGHQTVTARAYFFGKEELQQYGINIDNNNGNNNNNINNNSHLSDKDNNMFVSALHQTNFPNIEFDWEKDYEYQEELISGGYHIDTSNSNSTTTNNNNNSDNNNTSNTSSSSTSTPLSYDYQETHSPLQWMALILQTPVYCTLGSLIIASKLDATNDVISSTSYSSSSSNSGNSQNVSHSSTTCRLAFYGPIKDIIPQQSTIDKSTFGNVIKDNERNLHKLRLFRWKQKECEIHRLVECKMVSSRNVNFNNLSNINETIPISVCFEAIAWKLYHKNATIKPYLGLKLMNQAGEVVGVIHSPFGSSDKFHVKFPYGVPESQIQVGTKLYLRTKKYYFEKSKTFHQNGIEIENGEKKYEINPIISTNNNNINLNNNVSKIQILNKNEQYEISNEENKHNFEEKNNQNESNKLHEVNKLVNSLESLNLKDEKSSKQNSNSLNNNNNNTSESLPISSPSSNNQNIKKLELQNTDSSHTSIPLNVADIGVKKKKVSQSKKSQNSSTTQSNSIETSISTSSIPNLSSQTELKSSLNDENISSLKSSFTQQSQNQIPQEIQSQSQSLELSDTGNIRVGTIESMKQVDSSLSSSQYIAIVVGCFRVEENIRHYISPNSNCYIDTNLLGNINAELVGPYAKLGKCKVQFLLPENIQTNELVGKKVVIKLNV